jgi:UDP-N-acetyl-D-mannosaminuronic acid dehydrogenase
LEFQAICVLGLGYIGLPTASTFATQGVDVFGVDVNQGVVDALRAGQTHIQEPGLRTLVQAAFASGHFEIAEQPRPADAFIISVPTPIQPDKRADLSYVEAAARSVLPHLRAGNLVVLESTCPPRTTVDMLGPILAESGLTPGKDFHLAYTPERVLPGKILQELIENPRVIGGIDRQSAEAGRDLYRLFVRGEILLTDSTTAELVKLMENTTRDVNIALANEFAKLAEDLGVDVWQAVDYASRHPRVKILRPGPGVGGHCISIDPWFLVEAAPDLTKLIAAARQVNDDQPKHAVALIRRAVGGIVTDKTIAALGLAYKADVDDLRESPAVAVVRQLVADGADVITYDPAAPNAAVSGARQADSLEGCLRDAEAVVLLVDHHEFLHMKPAEASAWTKGRTAIDTRGVWDRTAWRDAGWELHVLGVGGHD